MLFIMLIKVYDEADDHTDMFTCMFTHTIHTYFTYSILVHIFCTMHKGHEL